MEQIDDDCRHGKLDEVLFHLHCMREPDYIMSLMSMYRTEERMGVEKTWTYKNSLGTITVRFHYPETIHNHFKYRHIVDDHSAKRQSPMCLEETWLTHWLANRGFVFILAVSEVSAMLCETYFSQTKQPRMLDFRKQLASELITNYYDETGRGGKDRKSN